MSPDFEVSANLRFWPVLEIATFELLAENRPFGIAQRHQFKCNGHSPLVAGYGNFSGRFGRRIPAIQFGRTRTIQM